MKLNSRGGGTGKGMIWSAMKQPNNDGKCSSLSVEGEDEQEKTEASLVKQETDKGLNSSKTGKMKTIFAKETAVGRLTAPNSIQQEQRQGGILLSVLMCTRLPRGVLTRAVLSALYPNPPSSP